jgi:hypothetical protein
MSALDFFLVELLGDSAFAPSAVEIRRAYDALDLEADTNAHATVVHDAIVWIANQRQHPLRERVECIGRLVALKGYNVVNLKEFCGW